MAQQHAANRAIALGSLSGTASYIWSQVIWPWLVPVGAPLTTALLGWAQGLPLMYIWVGALVAFATATTGALRLDEWRARRRVEHKLGFSHGRFVRHIKDSGAYGLGLQVINFADFPIEFEVVELRTRIENRVPAKRTSGAPRRIIIGAGGVGWWDDATILLDLPKPGTVSGQIEFRLRYGRPGSLKYELSGRKQVAAQFDEAGNFVTSAWSDLVN